MRNISGLRRGGPGRPKGGKSRNTVETQEFCAGIIEDPVYLAALATRMRKGRCAPAVECLVWYYARGKPKEMMSVQGRLMVSWQSSSDVPAFSEVEASSDRAQVIDAPVVAYLPDPPDPPDSQNTE